MEVDGEDLNNALYIFSKKLFKNPTLHNVKTYFQLLKTKYKNKNIFNQGCMWLTFMSLTFLFFTHFPPLKLSCLVMYWIET